ncbi:MAG: DUF2996 domain-containing protein [Cyanobacteriota bacterium]|nr:DUF2996 domain-containing protein [Cyanobacteriota bacterium]
MAEENTPNSPKEESATDKQSKPAAKPAAKAKKPKPPALEDKPFTEFIEQHFLPSLKTAAAKEGTDDLELKFVKEPLPIVGASANDTCWQVQGNWGKGLYQFNLYFPEEKIKGQKGFSFSTNGAKPSILESFMIDERKVTLDLMVLYTLQRLNAEKLLAIN